MKRKNVLYALLCLLVLTTMGSFKSPHLLQEDNAAALPPPPPQFTITQSFTVLGTANTGTAKLQYNSTGIYLTPTAIINGVGNVPLHIISHSSGPIYLDKWEGTIIVSGIDYTVTMVISGWPGVWSMQSVTAYSII